MHGVVNMYLMPRLKFAKKKQKTFRLEVCNCDHYFAFKLCRDIYKRLNLRPLFDVDG